jgi:hypothetical protein
MRRIVSMGASVMMAAVTAGVFAQSGPDKVSATLNGPGEVPIVSTPAQGSFKADIDDAGDAVDWSLTYSGLQAPVSQAHIHFGQSFTTGGIVVWLCKTNQDNAPAGTQDCPASGTISGTFTPADVVTAGTGAQGISAGEFEEVVQAMRDGNAYANVHTSQSPGGEIRGQIKRGNGP